MDVSWEVRVQTSHVTSGGGAGGGAALLTCSVPSVVRSHVSVTSWYKDGALMPHVSTEAGEELKLIFKPSS